MTGHLPICLCTDPVTAQASPTQGREELKGEGTLQGGRIQRRHERPQDRLDGQVRQLQILFVVGIVCVVELVVNSGGN